MHDNAFDTTLKSGRLREILQQGIAEGQWKPGDRLPSEPELVALYRVSRSTVREAITALVSQGLLHRIHGKGTFIAEEKTDFKTLAVVFPYLFFSDTTLLSAGTDVIPRLMQSVEGEAQRIGANLLLYLDNHRTDLERENIVNLLERQVDGVLLNYIGGDRNLDCVERIRTSGTPLVMIDRYLDELPVDFVVTDNVLGAYGATRALIAQGFEQVVHLKSPSENTSVRDRTVGYERAIAEAGLPLLVHAVEDRRLNEQGQEEENEEDRAFRQARDLLETVSPPFAVFATDAPILAGLWRAIQEYDLPRDQIAFACFDEPFIPFPKTVFSLKVIQPVAEIGRRSVQILKERMAGTGPKEPYREFLAPEIIASKP